MDKLNINLLKQLSKTYGDAFYILNSNKFEHNYMELQEAFSSVYSHFNIAYSYKTNYIPQLCKIVNKHGGYAEVVSDMELELALRCGVDTKKIIWNGPIKNLNKVEKLLINGGTVNIDSMDEINSLQPLIEKHPIQKLNIGIRCNFDIGDNLISRFGIDVNTDDFINLLNFIKNSKNLFLNNIHCHFANRSLDFWPIRVSKMIILADKVKYILGYNPERIDLGGGIFGKMPIELKKQFKDKIPEYKEYANCLIKLNSHFPNNKPELLIEPGTALVADCMKFVCRIKSIKNIRKKTFITVLGSQKNINMNGINPPIEIFNSSEGHDVHKADIVGYTCIESDILYKNFSGKINIDDYLVFDNCGSYSIVMKPPFIMENFPILDIDNHQNILIKRQEYFDDLFHTYNF